MTYVKFSSLNNKKIRAELLVQTDKIVFNITFLQTEIHAGKNSQFHQNQNQWNS